MPEYNRLYNFLYGWFNLIMNLQDLFNKYDIDQWGICPFNNIKNNLIKCRAITKLPENSKSIIVCLFPYLLPEYTERNLSRYACVKDYHIIALNILSDICNALINNFPENKFVCFTDNSPIPEVKAAVYANLGVIGRHGLLINKSYGSWVFIGEIVTDLYIPAEQTNLQYCINCGLCQEYCPGNAIGNHFDKSCCVSFITQKKGELNNIETKKIINSGLIWGCDKCQEICPLNKNIKIKPYPLFLNDPQFLYYPDINYNDDISDRAFNWRGKNILKRNFDILNKK